MGSNLFGINTKLFIIFLLLIFLNLRVIIAAPKAIHCIDYSGNDATLFFSESENNEVLIEVSKSYKNNELLFKVSRCKINERLSFVCKLNDFDIKPYYSYDRKKWFTIENVSKSHDETSFNFVSTGTKVFIALTKESITTAELRQEKLEYSYEKLSDYIDSLNNLNDIESEKIGESFQGRDIYKFTITDNDILDDYKKHVWLNFRIHGDEATQSFVLEGIIEFLLGGTAEAKEMLKNTVYHIMPLINPDGAFNNERENANGIDLNRNWSSPETTFVEEPEVKLVHDKINELINQQGKKIAHIVDFHGWHRANDGGFRSHYNAGKCSVEESYYKEQKSYVSLLQDNDEWQSYWEYTPGKITMTRIALYKEHGASIITQEYPSTYRHDSSQVSSEQFRQQGVDNLKSIDSYIFPLTFNDAAGNSVSNYYKNDLIYFTCDDYDAGITSKYKEDICTVTVYTTSGDSENVVLYETGDTTGIFNSSEGIRFENSSVVNGDGIIQISDMSELCLAIYKDSDYEEGISWDYVTLHSGETKKIDSKSDNKKLSIKTINSTSELQININGIKSYKDISVSIVSLNGRLIKKINSENILNGKIKIKKDMNIAKGLYFCSINGLNVNKHFPLIIK